MSTRTATVPGRGTSTPPGGPLFLPYVFGASLGAPSRGRPERVLGALRAGLRPESVIDRLGRDLAEAVPRGPRPGTGGRPRRQGGGEG